MEGPHPASVVGPHLAWVVGPHLAWVVGPHLAWVVARRLAFPLVDGQHGDVPLVVGRLAGHPLGRQGSLPWLYLACLNRHLNEVFEALKSRPSHGEGGQCAY